MTYWVIENELSTIIFPHGLAIHTSNMLRLNANSKVSTLITTFTQDLGLSNTVNLISHLSVFWVLDVQVARLVRVTTWIINLISLLVCIHWKLTILILININILKLLLMSMLINTGCLILQYFLFSIRNRPLFLFLFDFVLPLHVVVTGDSISAAETHPDFQDHAYTRFTAIFFEQTTDTHQQKYAQTQ